MEAIGAGKRGPVGGRARLFSGLCLAVLCCLAASAAPRWAGAQEAPAKSSDAAVSQYTRAVRVHNNRAYVVAEEEWSAFLKQFPQDPLSCC